MVFGTIASMKSLAIRREQLAISQFIRLFEYICLADTGQEEQQESISWSPAPRITPPHKTLQEVMAAEIEHSPK